jgi:hypothetical protein
MLELTKIKSEVIEKSFLNVKIVNGMTYHCHMCKCHHPIIDFHESKKVQGVRHDNKTNQVFGLNRVFITPLFNKITEPKKKAKLLSIAK